MFRMRVLKQWKWNSKLFKSIADWTVLLYLLIPATVFLYYLYRETVLKGEFGVFEMIPFPICIFLLLIIASGGFIRTFVEPADRLFYIQHNIEFRKLKALSFFYSIVIKAIFIIIMLVLFSPVSILYYGQDIVRLLEIGNLLLISYVVNTFIHLKFNRKIVQFLLSLGVVILLTILAVSFSGPISLAINFVFFILLCVLYWVKYGRTTKHFDKQIDLEIQAYNRMQSMIFTASPELKSMKPSKLPVREPILFKNRLFKKNEDYLMELLGKTLLRHRKYIWGYIRLVLVIIGLIFALPLWAEIALAGVTFFMLKGWVQTVVFEIKSHSIFVVYQVEDLDWLQVEKRFSRYLATYPTILIVMIIGLAGVLM